MDRLSSSLSLSLNTPGYVLLGRKQLFGFSWFGGEGKTMGLAAYGEPRFDFPEFSLLDDGYAVTGTKRNRTLPYPTYLTQIDEVVRFWGAYFEGRFGSRAGAAGRYDQTSWRAKAPEWSEQDQDIAASVQAQLERVLCHLAALALRWTGSKNLVLSGGVALQLRGEWKDGACYRGKYVYLPCGWGCWHTGRGGARGIRCRGRAT